MHVSMTCKAVLARDFVSPVSDTQVRGLQTETRQNVVYKMKTSNLGKLWCLAVVEKQSQ